MRKIMKKWMLVLLVLGLLTGCAGRKTPVASGSSPGESGSTQGETGDASGGTQPGTSEAKPKKLILESFGPDENSIVWMTHFYDVGGSSPSRTKQMQIAVDAVNQKLEEDGKTYRLKVIAVGEITEEALRQCGADIVTFDDLVDYDILDAGLMAPIDEWLTGSRLYDTVPEVLWERGWYRGSHYIIAHEGKNHPIELQVNTKYLPDGLPEFDGNLLSLEKYVSPEHPLFIQEHGFKMLYSLGYFYNGLTGMVFRGEECIDPLEDENIVELLRTLNRWHQEGKLVCFSDVMQSPDVSWEKVMSECSFAFDAHFSDNWETAYGWKPYTLRYINGTGILASSEKKAEAFALLEQIYADRDYANALGLCENPRNCFGLEVGIRKDREPEFSTLEERKRYYEENVLLSPDLHLDFPSEREKLKSIEEQYLGGDGDGNEGILVVENFDAFLEEFRNALKEPMEKAIKEVNASRRED